MVSYTNMFDKTKDRIYEGFGFTEEEAQELENKYFNTSEPVRIGDIMETILTESTDEREKLYLFFALGSRVGMEIAQKNISEVIEHLQSVV